MPWLPIDNVVPQYFNPSTNQPYSGAVLKAYEAGTTTAAPLATDSTGGTTASSIALNASGYPEVSGNIVIPHIDQDYKLALYPSQAAADADSGADWTVDNIALTGLIGPSEWIASGLTPTYVSGTSFSFTGDQTTVFHPGRRLQISDSGGTVYATVLSSSYSDPTTTITILPDTDDIDSGISAVSYGVISGDNTSAPGPTARDVQATTSGRSVTFSDIPSWATQIIVSFIGVSIDGSSDDIRIQLGDSGGVESENYLGACSTASGGTIVNHNTSFIVAPAPNDSAIYHGLAVLTRADPATNTWAISGNLSRSNTGSINNFAGTKALSSTLTQVRVGISSSNDDFDAGSVGLWYT